MPSKSKKQQRFFGLVKSIQEGKTPASASSKAAAVAKKVTRKNVSEFAASATGSGTFTPEEMNVGYKKLG